MDNPQYHNPYSAGVNVSAPAPGGQIYGESLPTIVVVTCVLEILFLAFRGLSIVGGVFALAVVGGGYGPMLIPAYLEILFNVLMMLIGGPIVVGMLLKQAWAAKYSWVYIAVTAVSYLNDVWKVLVALSQNFDSNAPEYIYSIIGSSFVMLLRIGFLVLFIAAAKKFKDYMISKSLYPSV